jgi:hypothetical protein
MRIFDFLKPQRKETPLSIGTLTIFVDNFENARNRLLSIAPIVA